MVETRLKFFQNWRDDVITKMAHFYPKSAIFSQNLRNFRQNKTYYTIFSSVNHACYDGTNHFAWFWHQKFDFQRVLTTFEIGPNHILWRHVTSDNRNFFFRRNQNNSSGGAHLKMFCSWYFSKALYLLPARGVLGISREL